MGAAHEPPVDQNGEKQGGAAMRFPAMAGSALDDNPVDLVTSGLAAIRALLKW